MELGTCHGMGSRSFFILERFGSMFSSNLHPISLNIVNRWAEEGVKNVDGLQEPSPTPKQIANSSLVRTKLVWQILYSTSSLFDFCLGDMTTDWKKSEIRDYGVGEAAVSAYASRYFCKYSTRTPTSLGCS